MPAKTSKQAIQDNTKQELNTDLSVTATILGDEETNNRKETLENIRHVSTRVDYSLPVLEVKTEHPGRGRKDLKSYIFSASELMKYEMYNSELRDILASGKYVYCEGFVCLNIKSLFSKIDGLMRVKSIVKLRPDLYCIKKERVKQEGNSIPSFRFIRAQKDRG